MSHGGKRKGAGRPAGQGPYGEPTERVRVPASLLKEVKQFAATKGFKLPLYRSPVQAGMFTEADSEVEEHIDINGYLVKSPLTTFIVPVKGESMIDAGIREGDLLVVDRGVEPANGKIVLAAIDDKFTVKFLRMKGDQLWLAPANPEFKPILVDKKIGIVILGVVVGSLQKH